MSLNGVQDALDALNAGRAGVIWQRQIADTDTPVAAALKLVQEGRGDWLLESVEGGETRGRYSLLGLDPDLMFEVRGNSARINRNWRTDQENFIEEASGALTALRNLVAECWFDVPSDLPKALAVLVGFFAYETTGLVEKLPRASGGGLALPDMIFVRPGIIVIFDRLADELFLVAPVWPDANADVGTLVAAAAERIELCAAKLAAAAPVAVRYGPLPSISDIRPTPHTDPARYAAMVAAAKDYIVAGDIFQVVLSQRFSTPFPLAPLDLYRALRRINPSPFLYFLDLPGFSLIGSSPEILVRVRDGQITIRPIAGTRPRGQTAAEDIANRDSLLADPKERAEHLMLLDLGRNDVGRAAVGGSVTVTDSYTVEYYSHVMHIVSNVVGELAPGKDAIDALFAGFPAGTVSGAPKVRACEIIAELEADARGPYAGGVGYFGPDGNMDSCIVLRTAILRDGVMHVQAGAGIVADSDPAYEQRECEAKAGALFAAAREAVRLAGEAGYGQ